MADTKKPLAVTDRRKHKHHQKAASTEGQGEAKPLAIFNDRRKTLGSGKRAS